MHGKGKRRWDGSKGESRSSLNPVGGSGVRKLEKTLQELPLKNPRSRDFWRERFGRGFRALLVMDMVEDAFRALRESMLGRLKETQIIERFEKTLIETGFLCNEYKPLFLFESTKDKDCALPEPLVPFAADGLIFTRENRKYSGPVKSIMLLDALENLELHELHVCGAYAESTLIESLRELRRRNLAKDILVEGNAVLFENPAGQAIEQFYGECKSLGIPVLGDLAKTNGLL